MFCPLSEALTILDEHWQCLTNFEQRYWIFETLYDLGDRSLGLLCNSLEMNPARASMQILTQISADPALAVLLYEDLLGFLSPPAMSGFLWVHLKLALTYEQAEHLFHEECLRRWERTAVQFREAYYAGYYDEIENEGTDNDLWFLTTLDMLIQHESDFVCAVMRPSARIIDAEKTAYTAYILGHNTTECEHAEARESYRALLQTLKEDKDAPHAHPRPTQ
jgi:hypothetical protein